MNSSSIPFRKISQKDIAVAAHVHITTVSLALRDSPRLPLATRQRIRKLADEMGYIPDPMLAALICYRRNASVPHYQGTFAWMNTFKQNDMRWHQAYSEYQTGARARCAELGYQLEEFRLTDFSTARLVKVLKSRNIQGLLIPPHERHIAHLHFEWENFSSVAFGFSLAQPRLHLITSAQYRSSHMAVRAMRKCGYRKIGFATTHRIDTRTNQNFSSGYLAEQRRFSSEDQVPMFIFDDTVHTKRENYLPLFSKWYEKHRPEAILILDDEVLKVVKKLGISYDTCGIASLAVGNVAHGIAGIYQNGPVIGQTAVDFLVGMIHRNERGVPRLPLQILVEGTWVAGASLPRSCLNSTDSDVRLIT